MDVTNRLTTVVGIEGVQSYVAQIRAMQGAVSNLKQGLAEFGITGQAVAELTVGVGLLTMGFKLAAFSIREASKELKYLRVMTYAFNSRPLAMEKMGEIGGLSNKYGIEKEALGSTYSRLAAFGIAPKDLKHSTVAMTDLAASTGDRNNLGMVMERLALIQEMGGISNRSMTALARQGINVHQLVAQQLAREKGGSAEQYSKMLSKPGGAAIKGIDDPFAFMIRAIENSNWKGIALKEAQGFGGSMARIGIAWGNFWDSTGEQIIGALTPLARAAAWAVTKLTELNEATGGKAGLAIILGSMVLGLRLMISAVVRSWVAIKTLTTALNQLAASAVAAAAASRTGGAVGTAAGAASGAAGGVATGAAAAALRVGLWTRINLWLSGLPGAVRVAQFSRFAMGGFKMLGRLFAGKIGPLIYIAIGQMVAEMLTGLIPKETLAKNAFARHTRGIIMMAGKVLNPFEWGNIIAALGNAMGRPNKKGADWVKSFGDEQMKRTAEEGGQTEAEKHLANIDKNTAAMANVTAWGNKDWRLDPFIGSRLRRAERSQLAAGRPG